jgi:hypothetical protein
MILEFVIITALLYITLFIWYWSHFDPSINDPSAFNVPTKQSDHKNVPANQKFCLIGKIFVMDLLILQGAGYCGLAIASALKRY